MLISKARSLTVLTVTALTGALLSTVMAAPATAAVMGTVTKDVLNVRSGPRLEYYNFADRQRGDRVALQCHTSGEEVAGNRRWFQLANGGFVPAVFVDHPGGTSECAYAAAPPRANPRTKDAAIDWQFRRLGSTAYEGDCLIFARLSYGWGSSGWATAEIGGDWMVNHGRMHTAGVPPRGALVWYHNSAGTGHIVTSIGDGKIIGTSVNGRVDIAGYLYRSGYRGWSIPYFPLAA